MFLHPSVLILLWLPPLWAGLALALRAGRRARAARLAGRAAAARASGGGVFVLQVALCAAGLELAVLALARPQWGEREVRAETSSRNLLVLLDVSRSMLAGDVRPSRLARAKADLADLVPQLRGDRAALVAFRKSAVTLCPFTTDTAFLLEAIEGAEPDSAPRGETDLGSALEGALATLKPLGDAHNAILLVSDGEDLTGRAERAAKECGQRGIPVFCFGVGTARGATIPDGAGGAMRHRGEEVTSRLEGRTLAAVAAASGGGYLPVEATATGARTLGTIYRDHVRRLVEAEKKEDSETRRIDRFPLFLAPALALLMAAAALSRGRPGARPRPRRSRAAP